MRQDRNAGPLVQRLLGDPQCCVEKGSSSVKSNEKDTNANFLRGDWRTFVGAARGSTCFMLSSVNIAVGTEPLSEDTVCDVPAIFTLEFLD